MSAQNPAVDDATDIATSNSFADFFAEASQRAEVKRRDRVVRIHRVDIKVGSCEHFGNDTDVDTKCCVDAEFGNDAGIGFIRVRKRKLKGGHGFYGKRATSSVSFDLVRAVRVDGKPRHEFLLGFGSQKDIECNHDLCRFWVHAIHRMTRHELAEEQRQRLISEMVRKGARLPTQERRSNAPITFATGRTTSP
jgi:hypothetical protein